MDLHKEFQNHAHECRRMAEFTKDPETRGTWAQMAERWERVAQQRSETERCAAEARQALVRKRASKAYSH